MVHRSALALLEPLSPCVRSRGRVRALVLGDQVTEPTNRRARWARWLAAVFLLLAPSLANGTDALGTGAAATAATSEPVLFHGRELFRVQFDLPPFSRADRAQAIERRIDQVSAATPAGEDLRLRTENLGRYAQILAGDQVLAVVTERDGEPAGLSAGRLARLWASAIEAGVNRQREEDRLLPADRPVLRGSVGVLLFALTWRLVEWLGHRLEANVAGLELPAAGRGSTAAIAGALIESPIGRPLRAILSWVRAAILAVLTLVLVQYLFSLHPLTRGMANRTMEVTVAPLRALRDGLAAQLPNLVFLTVLGALVVGIHRVLQWLLDELESGRRSWRGFEPEWARPTFGLARIALFALAAIVAFPYLPGAGTAAFNGISIFLGLLVTIASGGVISNLVAGFLISYSGSFRKGEWVRIGGHFGEVVEKRLITTAVRTLKGVMIAIPNAIVLAGPVENLSRLAGSGRLFVPTRAGIGYEVPWRQVEAMLLLAAARTPEALREPAPFVLQTDLGDFAVTYELNAGLSDPRRLPALLAGLHRNIQDVFNEHGVQIMTPNYVADPPEPKVVPEGRWHAPPARP